MNSKILKIAEELDEFTKNFKNKHGITYFEHSRIYHDGKIFFISDNSKYLEHFFKNKYSRPAFEVYNTSGIFLWDGIPELLTYDPQVLDMKLNFNIDHGVSFVKIEKGYLDIHDFATTSNRQDMINFYINNKDILDNFYQEYTDKFSKIINNGNNFTTIPLRPKNFNHNMNIAALFNNLTQREEECLDLLSKGYTAKMTANALTISSRTVEKHIENIKEKFNVKHKAELISKYKDYQRNTRKANAS
jgi:DNA-binding CsgD family transcriptional regulator